MFTFYSYSSLGVPLLWGSHVSSSTGLGERRALRYLAVRDAGPVCLGSAGAPEEDEDETLRVEDTEQDSAGSAILAV